MMTVNEVSALTGLSIRTLRYYDTIGLLKPQKYTEAGYRLYDTPQLERLRQIMLFRELEFPLKEIKTIIDAPGFEKDKALRQQTELLRLKKEHIERLIAYAEKLTETEEENMDFTAFDKTKIEEYSKKAKAQWGKTDAYKEYEEKSKSRSDNEQQTISRDFMKIFEEFGKMLALSPADGEVQKLVEKLQNFITEHYYTCTKEILKGLGQMYACGSEFTENIDKAGGKGTAAFAAKAIEIFCENK